MQGCDECGAREIKRQVTHRPTCSHRLIANAGEMQATVAAVTKYLTASEMGRKGGAARAARLTPEQRSEAARKAARARWDKHDGWPEGLEYRSGSAIGWSFAGGSSEDAEPARQPSPSPPPGSAGA